METSEHMAITEKPKKAHRSLDAETRAKEIINRGMASAGGGGDREKPVTFRLTEDVIERIDNARKARKIKTSKQTWFMEAILEKLEQEGY
jgi:hypothetical protein